VEVGVTTWFLGPSLDGSYVDSYDHISTAGLSTMYGALTFSVSSGEEGRRRRTEGKRKKDVYLYYMILMDTKKMPFLPD